MTSTSTANKSPSILVTRPSHQAQTLCAHIEARGGQAVQLPALEIVPLEPEHNTLADLTLAKTQPIILFVSANAVHQGLPWLQKFLPDLNAPHITWVGMGPATQKIMVAAGLNNTHIPAPPYNTETLLALSTLQEVTGKKIFIIAGEGGRPKLYNTLVEQGADVKKVACYRRVRPEIDLDYIDNLLASTSIDYVVATSNETLSNLYDLLGPRWQTALLTWQLVVISQRALAVAERLGFKQPPIVAASASDEAIADAIWQAEESK